MVPARLMLGDSECRHNKQLTEPPAVGWRTPIVVVICGCLIAMIAFGPRSSLGFFLTPMSQEHHWGRDVFSMAIAIQNLLWGIGQPFAGGDCRSFRRQSCDDRRRCILCARPRADGARHHARHARYFRRRADRAWVVRLLVQPRDRRFRQVAAGVMALTCVRCGHGRRFVWPVSLFADRRRADGQIWLADSDRRSLPALRC